MKLKRKQHQQVEVIDSQPKNDPKFKQKAYDMGCKKVFLMDWTFL